MGFWPVVKDMIKNVDILLLIADARMPDISVNLELVQKSKYYGKQLVIVYNKIDLVSKKDLVKLRNDNPDAFFVSGIKNINMGVLRRHLQIIAKRLKVKDPKIGVVGYPNIGKSAVINALAHGRRANVSDLPGTTKGVQWIKAGGLMILDSPGVIPFEDKNSKLSLLGAKSPDKMQNPEKSAKDILMMFLIKDKKSLQEYYKLDNISLDVDQLFIDIAKKRGYLLKKGEIDERRTAVAIVRNWQKGKLKIL